MTHLGRDILFSVMLFSMFICGDIECAARIMAKSHI